MVDNTKKISFRIANDVAAEIDEYAAMAGMTRSAFVNIAVVIGMRALVRQIAPERFLTPEMVTTMRAAGFGIPDDAVGVGDA